MKDLNSNLIYSYTRAQAIADGMLIDVSETAQEAGIKYPVALTKALWYDLIVPSEEMRDIGQTTEGRLWDLLFLFVLFARNVTDAQFLFRCLFLMKPSAAPESKTIQAHIGPGDFGEPVITFMLPEED